MRQPQKLLLEPDWPRMRQLVAKRLNISEDEVQAKCDSGDSLDEVEVATAIEELLDDLRS
jgi:hypothetical protein